MTAISSNLENQKRLFVGVDLAKSVFQVAYKDPETSRFHNRKLSRSKFNEFLIDHQGSLCVGMEACGSAHYWGRECVKLGHEVKIVPAQTVKFVNQGNKDDRNDAFCIWQAMHMPDLRTVKIRDESNQMLMALLKLRDLIIKQKTQMQNNLRACLYELGTVCNLGSDELIKTAENEMNAAHEKGSELSELMAMVFTSAINSIKHLALQLQTIDKFISEFAQKNDSCKKLMTIPYIGPITATAIYAVMHDPDNFKNGRQFAAYAGFAPSHTGTGGKIVMGGIPLKGNPILKRVLFQACMAFYCWKKRVAAKLGRELDPWIDRLSRTKPVKKVVCAIADKYCRIAWTLLHNQECYLAKKSTLVIASIKDKRIKTRHMYINRNMMGMDKDAMYNC